jgi:hypothetical protein
MTATHSRYLDTAERIRAIHDQFPDGIDPEFDSTDLADLERELSDLRFCLQCNS